MPFKIIVYDNFFPYDDSECDVLGVRESYEDAVAYCKSIVDENLTGYYKDGISTDELYDHYKSFGEDPSIHPIPDGEELFSAWNYAKERCSEICKENTKSSTLKMKFVKHSLSGLKENPRLAKKADQAVKNHIEQLNKSIDADEAYDKKHKINKYREPEGPMKKLPQPSTLLLKAAQFSALKHRDQRRKDIESSPYINHPITVAHIIADIGGIEDPEILAAALLHDTIEDTKTKPSELEEMFGETIRRYVEEMTDDKALTKEIRKQKQIEHAPHLSVGATLIKLGDKISNVSDITQSPPVDWDIERRTQYLDWAEAVINNCQKVNTALEQHFSEVLSNGRKRIKNES